MKRFDDLTERVDQTTDQEQRRELLWQVQEVLHREVPVIFIWWGVSFPAVADNVGGFWPSPFNYLMWNVNEWYLTQ